MLTRWIVVVALAIAGCSGSSSSSPNDSAVHTFKLVPANNSASPPINVSLAVPSSWKEDLSDPSSPTFEVPGIGRGGSLVSLTAIELTGSAETRMMNAIEMQGLADGQRADLPGGRIWIQKSTGTRLHGRVFAPYPGGVVMAVAIIPDASKMPEIRRVFESMTVASAAP